MDKYAGHTPPSPDLSAYSPRADAIRAAAAQKASLRLEQESGKLREIMARTGSTLGAWTVPLVWAGLQGQNVEDWTAAAARGDAWPVDGIAFAHPSQAGDRETAGAYRAEASEPGEPGPDSGERGLPSVRSYWRLSEQRSDDHDSPAGPAVSTAPGVSGEAGIPEGFPAAYEDDRETKAAVQGHDPQVPGLFDLTSLSSLYERHPSFPFYSSLHSEAEYASEDQSAGPEINSGSGYDGGGPAGSDLTGTSAEVTGPAAEVSENAGLTGQDPAAALAPDSDGQDSQTDSETTSQTLAVTDIMDLPAAEPIDAGYMLYPPVQEIPACLAASPAALLKDQAVNKQRRTVFIGDSMTVGMQMYVGGDENEYWSAKNSMGYSWMADSGVPEVEGLIEEGTDVVILMGVNDLGNVGRYVDYMNRKAEEWRERGARTFFVSVTPVVDSRSPNAKNSRIENFNAYAQDNLRGVHYIDAYSRIRNSFGSPDGIHFDGSTYRAIYRIIHFYLYQGWYEEAGLRFYFDCGRPLNGWQYLEGEWQYMDGSGVRWIRKGRVGDVCLAPFPLTGITKH